jgi:hypothetical protein
VDSHDSEEEHEVFSVCIRGSKEFWIQQEAATDRNELDSHADTVVGGPNCVLISDPNKYATVYSFSDERKPFDKVPIGSIATAWVNPETGKTIILIFNEALYFGDHLKATLLCPNQMWAYGIVVLNTPKQ